MIRSWFFAAFTVLVWGITFVNTRALLTDFSALEIHVLRFGVAICALWGVEKISALVGGGKTRPPRCGLRDELLFAGMGFFGVAVYQLLENCAIHYTNASNVSILVALNPVITALFAWTFGQGRRPGGFFFAGFLIAIAGVVMVSLDGISEFHFRPLGDVMAIGAMLSWGGYTILVGRVNAKGYPQIWVMRRVFLWALLMMVPFAIWGLMDSGRAALSGSFAVTLDGSANWTRFSRMPNLVNLGFLGVFASATCFVLWNLACSALGVVRCTVALYLIPAVTVLFAFLFLDETLTAVSAVGAALTLAGVVVSDCGQRSRRFRKGPKNLSENGGEVK